MKINVIRLRRDAATQRVSERVFTVEADTIEGLTTGLAALDDIDPSSEDTAREDGE